MTSTVNQMLREILDSANRFPTKGNLRLWLVYLNPQSLHFVRSVPSEFTD